MELTPAVRGIDNHTFPRKDNGALDKDLVKQWFMESPFTSWKEFAVSKDWPIATSKAIYPTISWVREKMKLKHLEQMEELSHQIMELKTTIGRDIAKTLKEYPKTIDHLKEVIDWKIAQIKGKIHKEMKSGVTPEDSKVQLSVTDVVRLASAMSMITDAKHKSLLLNKFSLDVEIDKADTAMANAAPEEDKSATYIKWSIKGAEGMSETDYRDLWNRYMDRKVENVDDAGDAVPVPGAD